MKPSVKGLKRIAFEQDPKIEGWYNSQITPIRHFIEKTNRQIDQLLKDALKRKLFPAKAIAYYRSFSKDKTIDQQKKLRRLSLWINAVRDPQISGKYWKLIHKVKKARRRACLILDKLQYDNHFVMIDKKTHKVIYRPVEAIEYILLDQPTGNWSQAGLLDSAPVEVLAEDTAPFIVNNDFLYLQVDLTYDKKDILQLCDDAVSKAQNITGKSGSSARTHIQERLFNNLFLKHYPSGKSKSEALEKTERDLAALGITIEAETLNKKYLPRFKMRYGIKDIRELKKIPFNNGYL